jgi:hypothetical protein
MKQSLLSCLLELGKRVKVSGAEAEEDVVFLLLMSR